jgi:hypothetical protein
MLPKIAAAGDRVVGTRGKQLLSFVQACHIDESFSSSAQQGEALKNYLLEAVLSHCPRAVDTIMHPVSWGHPEVLRQQLNRAKRLTPDDLALGFQQGMQCACAR